MKLTLVLDANKGDLYTATTCTLEGTSQEVQELAALLKVQDVLAPAAPQTVDIRQTVAAVLAEREKEVAKAIRTAVQRRSDETASHRCLGQTYPDEIANQQGTDESQQLRSSIACEDTTAFGQAAEQFGQAVRTIASTSQCASEHPDGTPVASKPEGTQRS